MITLKKYMQYTIWNNLKQKHKRCQPQTVAHYLTRPESHPVVELGPFSLLGIFYLLPPDADCHRAKVFIYSKVVLVLCSGREWWHQKKRNREQDGCLSVCTSNLWRNNTCLWVHDTAKCVWSKHFVPKSDLLLHLRFYYFLPSFCFSLLMGSKSLPLPCLPLSDDFSTIRKGVLPFSETVQRQIYLLEEPLLNSFPPAGKAIFLDWMRVLRLARLTIATSPITKASSSLKQKFVTEIHEKSLNCWGQILSINPVA